MTVKELLTPVINLEFEKYKSQGYKIKLKSTAKKRILYTILCVFGTIIFVSVCPIVWIIYGVLMMKTNNIDIIISLAEKSPDMPIEQIIAQEIKK